MKIVHISTSDLRGGAARSAFRLHRALCALSQDSSMYVAQKDSFDPTVHLYCPEEPFRRRVSRAVRKEIVRRAFSRYDRSRPAGFEHFRDDRTEFGNEVQNQLPPADVVNLHWIAGFLDYRSFFPKTPLCRPTIWTLHDMNPFTGGCHFDASCGRFTEQCGSCPQLGSTEPHDLSRQVWARKKQTFEQVSAERLFLVAPSNWLAAEARRSSIFGKFSVTVIPYGVDTKIFCPRTNRDDVRRALEIPEGARVILFLAEEVNNRRKGFGLLNQALNELARRENIFLLSLGKGCAAATARIPHLHLGAVANDVLLATIYSVADIFAIPSVQDNLPNTVLEAMACGTPVVGFDAGGIRDMIRNGETGFLVPVENTADLAKALDEALKDSAKRARMGSQCRQMVIDHFSLELQAKRYSRLYQALLDEPQTVPALVSQEKCAADSP